MLGDIREGEVAFPLGSLTTASSQESAKPAITITVHRPEQDRLGVDQGDLGSDQQFEADLLGGDVSADHAGQAVPIGDRHPGIAQPGRLGNELVRVRRPFQEGEVRLAMKLDITDRRRLHGMEIPSRLRHIEFRRRLFGHESNQSKKPWRNQRPLRRSR